MQRNYMPEETGRVYRSRRRKRRGSRKRTSPSVPSRKERYKTELMVTGRDGMDRLDYISADPEMASEDEDTVSGGRKRLRFLNRTSRYSGPRAERLLESEERIRQEAMHADVMAYDEAFREEEEEEPVRKSRWGVIVLELLCFFMVCELTLMGMLLRNPFLHYSMRKQLYEASSVLEPYAPGARAILNDAEPLREPETIALKNVQEVPAEMVSADAGKAQEMPETETESQAGAIGRGEAEPVKLIFAGDIYLSDHVLEAYRRGGGIEGVVSKAYLKAMQEADYVIANEEFPFSEQGTPAKDKTYTFRLAPENVKLFKEMGIDLVSLANNHALDYGQAALLDTLGTLDQAGIRHMGAGRNLQEAAEPVVVSIKGRRIAFIAATRVIPDASWTAGSSSIGMFSAYDEGAALAEKIKLIRDQADFVIVYMHWGEERMTEPNDVQKALAVRLVDAGADLIVGAHPHVLQSVAYYKDVPIVYSLGNFVFGSSIPKTALLEVTIDKRKTELSADGTLLTETETDTDQLSLKLLMGSSANGYTKMD